MTVREYIGARYVPVFMGDWDNTVTYEPLSIVQYQGNSYTSRQYVPTGIEITNTDFWAVTGNYNAQVEAYRQEVRAYDDRITANTTNITTINDALPIADFDDENTVSDKFASIEGALPIADFDAENTVSDKFDEIEADSWVTTDRIADEAVTVDKIASSVFNSLKKQQQNVVIIGDSWTNADVYTQYLNMIYNYNIRKYAMGGAGFIRPSSSTNKSLADYANDAINDTSFDHSTIGHVILQGGVNDYRDNQAVNSARKAQLANAIETIVKALSDSFPNAKVYVLIGQLSWYQSVFTDTTVANTNASQLYLWNCIKNYLAQRGINAVCTYGWLNHTHYSQDDLHPNDTGYHVFAANVDAILKGNNPFFAPAYVAARDGKTTAEATMVIDENSVTVTYNVYLRETSTSNYLTEIASGAFTQFPVYFDNDHLQTGLFKDRRTSETPNLVAVEQNRISVFVPVTPVPADSANKSYLCSIKYLIRAD